MDLDRLYTLPKQLISDVSDLRLLCRSPNGFAARIDDEDGLSTARRLLIYGILFDLIIVIALLPAACCNVLSPWRLVLIGVLETTLAATQGLVYIASTRLLSDRPSPKSVVATTVAMKFLFLIPAVVLMAMYLVTESIPFLVLRGIAAWIGSISIPLLLPFVVARGARRRVLVGLVSLVLIVAVRMGVGLLSLQENHKMPEKLIKISLNYDPIGHELNSLDIRDSMEPHQLLIDLHEVYNDLLYSVDVSEGKLSIIRIRI